MKISNVPKLLFLIPLAISACGGSAAVEAVATGMEVLGIKPDEKTAVSCKDTCRFVSSNCVYEQPEDEEADACNDPDLLFKECLGICTDKGDHRNADMIYNLTQADQCKQALSFLGVICE